MKQDHFGINIAGNLSKLRKNAGMTQEQLACRLYVSDKTISKWLQVQPVTGRVVFK